MAKEKKIVVDDQTGTDNEDSGPKVSKKLAAKVDAMTPEEKAAFAAKLGLPVRKITAPKEKEPTQTDLFKEADARLAKQIESIHTILEGCKFPGGFSLSIGVDHEGTRFAKTKQVRAPYGPRGSKEDQPSA